MKRAKSTKKVTAQRINDLVYLKAHIAELRAREEELVTVLKRQGGGESDQWRAEVIGMPERKVVIRAHKQLRIYAKG